MASQKWSQLARHKKAATVTFIFSLVFIVCCQILIIMGFFNGPINGKAPTGRALLAILQLPIETFWINGVAAILSVGSAFISGRGVSDRIYYFSFGINISALILTIIALAGLHTEEIAQELYNSASIEGLADSASFKSAIRWFFGGIVTWLVASACTLVGVRNYGD